MRVYSNREDLGACSNNLLYIRFSGNLENCVFKIRISKILQNVPVYIRGYVPEHHCTPDSITSDHSILYYSVLIPGNPYFS